MVSVHAQDTTTNHTATIGMLPKCHSGSEPWWDLRGYLLLVSVYEPDSSSSVFCCAAKPMHSYEYNDQHRVCLPQHEKVHVTHVKFSQT